MKRWADYLISEVSYDKNHLISRAKRHVDSDNGISEGNFVDRIKICSDINNGLSYITIYNNISTWRKGNKIQFYRLYGEPFLRIDQNKVNQDHLGDILQIESPKLPEPEEATPEQLARLEQLEKQIAEIESPSQSKPPEPEPTSPRGSLPKESSVELPQELDLTPEPEPTSPRGSLPKESSVELPQELDLTPEPEPEPEEATPEQIARLEQLEKQIAELESQPEPEPEESTPEQIARLEQLEKQIAELESQ